jgi:hypothetical protein
MFVTHTDANLVGLFRNTRQPVAPALSEADRQRRLAAYERARDYAILAMPDDGGVFADEREAVVARAVAAGQATIDERGRLVFGRKLAATATPEAH